MASSLMKGSVTLTDGSVLNWAAGPVERIRAERALGIKITDLSAGGFTEEYVVFLAWASLRRQRTDGIPEDFDAFLDLLGEYDVEANPESEAPPAE